MTRTFEVAERRTAPGETHAGETGRQLPWWAFATAWIALLALVLATAYLAARAAGLLGIAHRSAGVFAGGSLEARGLVAAWLGGLAAVAAAWFLTRPDGHRRRNRKRLLAALAASHVGLASISSISLIVVPELVDGLSGGSVPATGLATGVVAAGALLGGGRSLGRSIDAARLLPLCVAVAAVAVALAPLSHPTDPSSLGFGVFLWSAGPVWFALASPRWFGAGQGAPAIRFYIGTMLFTIGTLYLTVLPRVLAGYG